MLLVWLELGDIIVYSASWIAIASYKISIIRVKSGALSYPVWLWAEKNMFGVAAG